MLKIRPQVKVMTWSEKVMLTISSLSSAWTQLWYLHRFSLPLSKVVAEKLLVTFHNLIGSVDLVDVTRGHRSQYSDSGWQVYLYPDVWVFRIALVQKRRISFFSHRYIMERSQTWSDLRTSMSKFRGICFINTVTTDIIAESLNVIGRSV